MRASAASRKAHGKVLVLGDGMTYFLSVIRSLGRKRIEVHTAWCAPRCPASRSRYVSAWHALPFPDASGGWKPALLELLRREQFDLVIPTNEQSMRPLQRDRGDFAAAGSIYLLDDHAFGVLFDKRKSADLARSIGMFVPRGAMAADLAECRRLGAEYAWPVVLKPLSSFDDADLSQRRAVVKAYNDEELEGGARRLLAHGPVLVQECFVGTGVGVEVLACHGEVLAEFQHERVHLPPRGGASTYRKSAAMSPELLEATRRLVARLNYTGVLMVEFLVNRDTREWRFVETNARFWGSLPLAVAAGCDFPYYLYRMLVDGERHFPRHYRTGLYCRNLTADLYWAHDNLRANRTDPTLMTVPLAQTLRELSHVLLLRERSDTLVCDDPWPGLVELGQFVRVNSAKFARRAMARAACAALGIPAVRQRATAKTRAALERAESVLFVCLGNICRSPFAEHYARRVLPAAVAVRSSGLYPRPNRPSPEPAILAASEQGVDLSRHRADVLNEESVGRSDLIFSFDESVHQEIRRRFPAARGKLHRFALLADDGPVEVPDPFGGSLARFRVVYRRIAAVLDSAAARLADGRLEDGSGIAPSQVARPNATADARGAATDCAAVSSGF
ncbi:MAG TPA: ATP-grasp domain-containing protein [Pirellulales bacterium]|jgi:protein-tyrosine-phosphatase/predicted ATP-grasp superfamily ATP-dependent carboligase|nr:ATP-grasp domain-containing protein [Pirellulales bacterium]